jgi:peptide/nickel transport system substrate-binding protein
MKTTRLNRRDLLLRSAAVTGGAVLAGRGATVLARARSAPVTMARSSAATSSGTVVTAIGTDPPGLDVCNPWNLGTGLFGMNNLPYDDWFYYDRNFKLQPYLAKGWTRVDPKTVIFGIRRGVLFHHTGRELTAADVVANIKRYTAKSLGCANSGLYSSQATSLTAVDKYRFKVTLSTPNFLVQRLVLPQPVDIAYTQRNGHPLLLRDEAGTGPWILTDWVPGTSITFERNPNYWRTPPQFGVFRFQIIPDESVATLALKTGQINFLPISKYENFIQVKDDPHINAWASPGSGYRRLNVNHLRPALQNPNVLQALRYGINRQQMVDVLSHGLGQVSGPVSPVNSFYALPNAEVATLQKYDPRLAMSYLQKAGYNQTDKRLKLLCLSIANFENFTDIAQVVAANLKQIGIDLQIKIDEIGVWVDSRVKRKDYDLSVNDYGYDPDPDFTTMRSDQVEATWTGGGDPNLDKLIDAMNVEVNRTKRQDLARQIQRLLITNVREIYLYAPPVFEAASKKLVGYRPWPGGTDLRAFTLDQVSVLS